MSTSTEKIYSAAFIFEPGEYDARFHALNALIKEAAEATPGYLGVESWIATDSARRNATYWWTSLEALKQFSTHPKHLEAKREYANWYRGYHIVVCEVVRAYGDNTLQHFTPNERARAANA